MFPAPQQPQQPQQPRMVPRDHRQNFNTMHRTPCIKENIPITMKTTRRRPEYIQYGIVIEDALYQRPKRAPYPSESATSAPSALELFMIKDILGKGAFGLVFLAEDRVRGSRHAIKTISKDCSEVEHELVLNEQQLMRELGNNPWFVTLDASWHDNKFYYLAMPFVSGGDLDGEVRRCGRLEPLRVLFYMAELVIALQTLHGHGVMHRDIKLANILLQGNGHIVLSDFGLSKRFARPTIVQGVVQPWSWMSRPKSAEEQAMYHSTQGCGTPQTMAPEIFQGMPYTFEVDYWSLAVVMYIMLVGRAPFRGQGPELIRKVIYGPLVFREDDEVPPLAKVFLRKMLEKDPEDRLVHGAIRGHSYFSKVDWARLERREVTPPYVPQPYVPSSRPPSAVFCPGIPLAPHDDPTPKFNYLSAAVRTALSYLRRPRPRVASAPTPAPLRCRQPQPPLPRSRVVSAPTPAPAPLRCRQPQPPLPPSRRPTGPSPASTALPTPPASRSPGLVKVAGTGTEAPSGPKFASFFSRFMPSRTGDKSVAASAGKTSNYHACHSTTSLDSSSASHHPAGKPSSTRSGIISRMRLWTRKIWSSKTSTLA